MRERLSLQLGRRLGHYARQVRVRIAAIDAGVNGVPDLCHQLDPGLNLEISPAKTGMAP